MSAHQWGPRPRRWSSRVFFGNYTYKLYEWTGLYEAWNLYTNAGTVSY